MAKREGESTGRQTRRGPLASRSALRTLLSLAAAGLDAGVDDLVAAVGEGGARGDVGGVVVGELDDQRCLVGRKDAQHRGRRASPCRNRG